jgi:hypothetical protein
MFSRIPKSTPENALPTNTDRCVECNCPADFEWLPCTEVCRQQERIDRLAPAPYPPLPPSDDESSQQDHEAFYEDREPSYDPLPALGGHMIEAYWTVLDPCWPQYEHEIGYLANFPHLIDEAQFIYALLVRKGLTRDELVRIICELEPEGLFTRSYTAVTWHLRMMEKAGIIYAQ